MIVEMTELYSSVILKQTSRNFENQVV